MSLVLAVTGCSQGTLSEPKLSDSFDPLALERVVNGGQTRKEANARILNEVTDCMRRRGWQKYQPSNRLLPPDEYLTESNPGFGVSVFAPKPALPVDPNADWMGALSSAEQEAFVSDLYGQASSEDEKSTDVAASGAKNSCLHLGESNVLRDSSVFSGSARRRADTISKGMRGDSRLKVAWKNWSECMKSSGIARLGNEEDISSQLESEFKLQFPSARRLPGAIEGVSDNAKFEAFQARERSLRKASDACYTQHVRLVHQKTEAAYVEATLK